MDSCQRLREQSRRALTTATRQARRVIELARLLWIRTPSVRRTRYNMFPTQFYRRICSIVRYPGSRLFSREHLKAMIAAAPHEEFEQTKLRFIIVGAILVYLLGYVLWNGRIEAEEIQVLAVTSGFLAFSVVLVLCVLAEPQESKLRRYIGMIGD